jgi:LuxR family transcriptional regulator, maltose regulon positive regulatory protein
MHGPEAVLRRAAGWYLERGDFEAGIRHLIEAGDHDEAVLLLLEYENDFLDRGMIGSFLAMAESLGPAAVSSDPRLGVAMAWAAGVSGRGDRVEELLDRSESVMDGTEPAPHGWSSLAGSAAALRATLSDRSAIDLQEAKVHARRAVDLEQDPALPGYSVARMALGLSLVALDALQEALPHLTEAWERSDVIGMPVFTRLAIAGVLSASLISVHRNEEARRVLTAVAPIAHRIEAALGEAAGPAVGAVRFAEARLAVEEEPGAEARERMSRAVDMVRLAGHPSQTVRALTLLGNVSLDSGDVETARNALADTREIVASEPVFPAVLAYLEETNNRLGRAAVGTARRQRQLAEDLTDRELSILRSLQGPLNQREIARELYLSINTVKGYTKSLYRKLGVSSREEAVQQATDLGLI